MEKMRIRDKNPGSATPGREEGSDLLPEDGAGEHRVVATLLRQVDFNGQLVLGVPHTRNLQLIMLRIATYTKFPPKLKGPSLRRLQPYRF